MIFLEIFATKSQTKEVLQGHIIHLTNSNHNYITEEMERKENFEYKINRRDDGDEYNVFIYLEQFLFLPQSCYLLFYLDIYMHVKSVIIPVYHSLFKLYSII